MKKNILSIIILVGSVIILPAFCDAQVNIITTFAGDSVSGYSGDDSLATHAGLMTPSGVAADRHGNIYIVDQNNNRCRKVDAAGIITTFAGTGFAGYNGDTIPATDAQLYWPTGVTVDSKGNVYIADQFNERIRKIDTAGIITTIAGNGMEGYAGDSGVATAAQFAHPADVGVDGIGNIYVIDQDNSAVRKIDTAGIITTIAGNGTAGFTVDSGLATAAQLNYPQGIAVDKHGNVFIADFYNCKVRKIDTSGIITTVAGQDTCGYNGDNGAATTAMLYDPSSVAVDDTGNVYISDYNNNRIRRVNTTGIIITIAGNGVLGYSGDNGPAIDGQISLPEGIAVDTNGNVFIADYNNSRVREVMRSLPLVMSTVTLSSLKIFPDPSAGKFIIEMNEGQYELNIYNIMGQVVYYSACNAPSTMIDISDKPDGIYLLCLRSATGTIVKKMVKINK